METTTFEQFVERARRDGLVPIQREVMADQLTPVSAFLKIAEDADYAFLLESVEGGEQLARYSFLGKDPFLVLTGSGDRTTVRQAGETRVVSQPLGQVLDETLRRHRIADDHGLPRFIGGAVGSFGASGDGTGLPATFMLFDTLLAFDHVKRRIVLVAIARVTPEEDLDVLYQFALARLQFLERELERTLSRPMEPPSTSTPEPSHQTDERPPDEFVCQTPAFDVYRALRYLHPSAYMFFLRFGGRSVAGSSHDMLVRVDRATLGASGNPANERPSQLAQLVESLAGELPAGAVGYLDFAGHADFCRATQTVVIEDGRVRVHAGPFLADGAAGGDVDSATTAGVQHVLSLAREHF